MNGTEPKQPVHLVVMQHGLWGEAVNLSFLRDMITKHAESNSSTIVRVLNSDVNEHKKTYDGIDVCGDRVVQLIKDTAAKLASEEHLEVKQLSFIGYSLGGLIMRFVVGKLEREGAFGIGRYIPVNFVTIASPHLGAWKMQPSDASWIGRSYNKAYHNMVPVIASMTGYQLMLKDQHHMQRPLLMNMSDPSLAFYQGLQRFERLIVLANVKFDNMVPYRCASINHTDPYENRMCVAAVDPVKYPSVVKPASEDEPGHVPGAEVQAGYMPCVFLCLLPVMLPILLIVLAVMSFQGKKHYCQSGEFRSQLRTSWLIRGASLRQSYEPAARDLETAPSKDESLMIDPNQVSDDGIDHTRTSIAEKQAWMVNRLNKLPWRKIDVEAQHRRAHAAIVVRIPKQCKQSDHLEYLLTQCMAW